MERVNIKWNDDGSAIYTTTIRMVPQGTSQLSSNSTTRYLPIRAGRKFPISRSRAMARRFYPL